MLSILIPAYNFDVRRLVEVLYHQVSEQGVPYEIIVIEDGSIAFVNDNHSIERFPGCRHLVLESNIGRAAIRNKLADEAAYNHLLFLDCDSMVSHHEFIARYLAFCHDEQIVLGGRIYDSQNADPAYSLIRKYGVSRERNDLRNEERRRKHPMFTTPNFLISKTIFNKVRFDENIDGYGHEDTLFGIKLKALGIEYLFIDNPVVHIGLEENSVFLAKTRKAVSNLYQLYIQGHELLAKESALLLYYLGLKRWRLVGVAAFLYHIFSKLLEHLLCLKNPSLLLYDVYKLGWLCSIASKK
jgi:glycosyltransferase involved in cell wall biosynthesis